MFSLLEEARIVSASRAEGTNIGIAYGVRGRTYRLQLYGYPRDPQKDSYCSSEAVPLTADLGIAPVHVSARCALAGR